jgi:5-bromo-4-chloroindolyl phosphate hydrolysis protein
MMKWKLSIQPLDGLSLRARIVIALVAILLASLILWSAAEGETQEQIYQGVPLNEHLIKVDREALEAAYREQIKLLFSVWLKDDISVVHRINTGLRRAREAYGLAAAKIEEREKAKGR